jgi:hypothetical protein
MQTRKTYLAIDRLMSTLEDADRQLYNIRGRVKQLPKGWHTHAAECGYDDLFCTLLDMFFLPHVVDKTNLIDFLIAHHSLKK